MRTKKYSKTFSIILMALVLSTTLPARADEKAASTPEGAIASIIYDYSFKAAFDINSPNYYELREKFEDQQIARIQAIIDNSGDTSLIKKNSWLFAQKFLTAPQQHPKMLKYFLDQGMDGNIRDPKYGEPLVTLLSLAGKADLVQLLAKDKRVDLNATACEKGFLPIFGGRKLRPVTALDWADNGVVDILLENGGVRGKEFNNTCKQKHEKKSEQDASVDSAEISLSQSKALNEAGQPQTKSDAPGSASAGP